MSNRNKGYIYNEITFIRTVDGILSFAVIWIGLQVIRLSEIRQAQQYLHDPTTYGILKKCSIRSVMVIAEGWKKGGGRLI